MPKATVIGGGFGGMAAALRLRARGHEVSLLDRCSRLGGRAQVFERDGYPITGSRKRCIKRFRSSMLYRCSDDIGVSIRVSVVKSCIATLVKPASQTK